MLDNVAIDFLCRTIAEQLTRQPQEFTVIEGTDDEFQSVAARFLEAYGGSLGVSLLLQHHKRMLKLRRHNLVDIVSRMSMNRRMGSDVLLEFYGRFTSVPLEQFSFLDELGIEHKTTYGASFFDAASNADDYGEWELATPDESIARIREQNNLPIEVTDELMKIASLNAQRLAPVSGLGSLSQAGRYGIKSYSDLRKLTAGTGLQAHHLLEQRFAGVLGVSPGSMSSIALTPAEHQIFTNAWRQLIPYGSGTANATREQIMNTARIIYKDYPDILKALGL